MIWWSGVRIPLPLQIYLSMEFLFLILYRLVIFPCLFIISIIFILIGWDSKLRDIIPTSINDLRWSWCIYKKRNKWQPIDNRYKIFRINIRKKDYILFFYETYHYELYRGNNENAKRFMPILCSVLIKQSNPFYDRSFCEEWVGKKIIQYYIERFINERKYKLKIILNNG